MVEGGWAGDRILGIQTTPEGKGAVTQENNLSEKTSRMPVRDTGVAGGWRGGSPGGTREGGKLPQSLKRFRLESLNLVHVVSRVEYKSSFWPTTLSGTGSWAVLLDFLLLRLLWCWVLLART